MNKKYISRILELLNFYSDTFTRISFTNLKEVGQIGVTLISSILNYRVAILLIEGKNKELELLAIKGLSHDLISSVEDLARHLWIGIDSPTIITCDTLEPNISILAKRLSLDKMFLTVPLKNTIMHKEERIGLAVAAMPNKNYEPKIDIMTLDIIASFIAGAVTICKMRKGLIEIDKKLETDIAERKKAEKSIEQLRLKNEMILNSAWEGIFGLDNQGNHTFVNPSGARLIGYKVEELLGEHSHAVWHHTKADGSPYPENECPIYNAYKIGAVHHITDEVFWRKDGTSFAVEYTSTPIIEDGKITGAVVTFTDITERKRTQELMQKSEAELKKRVKELEDFYDMAVGRELRMIQLKEEIEQLKEELEKYKK